MAFKVEDLMTKIVPGASPGPRIWACPDDSHGNDQCPDDSHGQGCPDDSRGQCPDDSRGQCRDNTRCPDDSNIPNCPDVTRCPDDSNIPPNCPDDSRRPYQAAGRGGAALALLQQQLRERLDSAPEAPDLSASRGRPSMMDLLGRAFRANPSYELTLWDRLAPEERRAIPEDPDLYGVLRSVPTKAPRGSGPKRSIATRPCSSSPCASRGAAGVRPSPFRRRRGARRAARGRRRSGDRSGGRFRLRRHGVRSALGPGRRGGRRQARRAGSRGPPCYGQSLTLYRSPAAVAAPLRLQPPAAHSGLEAACFPMRRPSSAISASAPAAPTAASSTGPGRATPVGVLAELAAAGAARAPAAGSRAAPPGSSTSAPPRRPSRTASAPFSTP